MDSNNALEYDRDGSLAKARQEAEDEFKHLLGRYILDTAELRILMMDVMQVADNYAGEVNYVHERARDAEVRARRRKDR